MMKYGHEEDKHEEEYLLEEKKAWEKVRERNLKINIAKQIILKNICIDKIFTRQEIKDTFAFKESDVLFAVPNLFDKNDDVYVMNSECAEFVEKVIQSNKAVKDCLLEAEADFIRLYGAFHAEAKKNAYGVYAGNYYKKMFEKLTEIIPIIHWGKLPIFNKYLLYNREMDPEMEMMEFYDHPDCLDALLNEVKDNGIILTNKSDETLDKEMPFVVYTRRWGHEDRYTIKRTVDGWFCGYMSIHGECEKNGEGGLFMNLDHDAVFYPKDGVKYALKELWEDADDGEIDFEELKKRMQQIADWISAVEKSISAQPEWVGYY